MTRIVALGDVHANATALRATLAAADSLAPDLLVFLGDLLTYGADVEETVELVGARPCRLLRGNHDQLYQDLLVGVRAYYDELPEWIQECADIAMSSLDGASFSRLPFEDEIVVDGVLLAHANPFAAKDWRYLRTEKDHESAAGALAQRGLRAGIFGHTHRPALYQAGPGLSSFPLAASVEPAAAPVILNAGSVGQPRGGPIRASLLCLDADGMTLVARWMDVDYDVDEHLRRVRALGLNAATTAKLCSYFGRDA